MITASDLAGYFAAHTVWCLSAADTFHPVLAYTTADGHRHIQRLFSPGAETAVEFGRHRLADNPMDANDSILLFDGRIAGQRGELDAIIIEMRCYGFPWAEATIAVPYTPKGSGGLKVHRPKLLRWHDCDDFDKDLAFEAFFRGVAAHEEGRKVWDASLDESQ